MSISDDELAEAQGMAPAVAARPRREPASWLPFALPAYFLLYLLIRLLEPGALPLDEAEIVYLTQDLRPGYGTQPPLYAWLQWLLFDAAGVNRFSLLVLKACALCLSLVAMYRTALLLLGSQAALAAGAALMLFPQLGWEALRIQTHSVLLTSFACLTLWLFFAMLRGPSWPRYALLGVLAGLGLQTKYNYGVFLACVGGASLFVPAYCQVFWNRRLWLSGVVALLLLLPHLAWVLAHPDAAFAGTVRKLQEGFHAVSYPRRVAEGLLSIVEAALSFALLPAAVFVLACWPARKDLRFNRQNPASRFFLGFYGMCLLLLFSLALTGQVGTIKERWMIPLLFCMPLSLLVMFPALQRQALTARITWAALGMALCLLALLPVRTWLAPRLGWLTDQHRPYIQLAAAIEQRCPEARTIVTDSLLIAGNLRFARPAWRTWMLEQALRERVRLDGGIVLVTAAPVAGAARSAFHGAYPAARPVAEGEVAPASGFGSRTAMRFSYQCFDSS